jgi:hypothetical protein
MFSAFTYIGRESRTITKLFIDYNIILTFEIKNAIKIITKRNENL